MKQGLIINFLILVFAYNTYAQPGIYSEQDISTQNLYMDSQLAKMQGKMDEQVSLLKDVLKRDKKCHACHYEISKANFAMGKYEPSLSSINKAIGLDSSNEWYLLLKSDILEKTEQYGEAAMTLSKLLTIQDDNPAIYQRLALQQLASNQPEKAVQTLRNQQNRLGIDEETSRRIFEIYSKSGRESEAISELNTLIKSDPGNTRYMNNLASYYKEIGQDDKAKEVYKDILAIDPNDSKASFALIKDKGKSSDGVAYLKDLESVITNMSLPLDNKIQELIPYLSTMKKGSAEAKQLENLGSKLVELYPANAKVYSVNGDVQYYNGDHKEAYENYKEAINIDDRKYLLWSQYMSCLWELADYKNLLKKSEEAMDLYPNNVECYIYHALALAKTNKKQDASNILIEAVFIAAKNKRLNQQIEVVKSWLEPSSANLGTLRSLSDKTLASPTLLELVGDIMHAQNDNAAQEYWNKSILAGGNESRIKAKVPIK